ncbi:MAG: FecR domain-containing protein [Bacteroidota bacterium]
MSSTRLSYLLERYMHQLSTPEETMELMELVKNSSNDEALSSLLEACWKKLPVTERLGSTESAEILKNILSAEPAQPVEVVMPSRSYAWLKIAAAAALIGIMTLFYQQKKTLRPNVATLPEKARQTAHRFITLPDGSTVILKGNSKLTYTGKLKGPKREVYLVGEGYFDVKHDASREFIIHTGKIQTTVLGTAFDIKALPAENKVQVTVTRGRVRVSNNEVVYGIITPNEQIVCNTSTQEYAQLKVNAVEVVSWKDEDLYFDDVTVAEIVKTLEERFKVKIKFANTEIKSCRLSATFLKSQSLSQVLEVIKQFNQINYTYSDSETILLTGEGCK